MRKAPLIVTLALGAAIGAYLLWAFPRLPAVVPMKWDMANRPVAFGTREAFVGIPAAIALLLTVLFSAVSWWQPKAAWLGPVVLGVYLFVVHAAVQAVLGLFLPVPINVAVLVALVGIVGPCVTMAVLERRRAARA
jgi:hypothetical protein